MSLVNYENFDRDDLPQVEFVFDENVELTSAMFPSFVRFSFDKYEYILDDEYGFDKYEHVEYYCVAKVLRFNVRSLTSIAKLKYFYDSVSRIDYYSP
jgi:hypothetical protein